MSEMLALLAALCAKVRMDLGWSAQGSPESFRGYPGLSDETALGFLDWDAGREGASRCTRGRVRSPGSIRRARQARGFTLVELILVMALLIIAISLVAPRLEQFFDSRTMDSEVNRFIALTRYAQSRAVSEGLPMVVWVDPKTGTYGLQQESGYKDADGKALNYTVGNGLKINVGKLGAKASASVKRAGFHFSPDGNVITGTSVSGVSIQEGLQKLVWIVATTNGMGCEIKN